VLGLRHDEPRHIAKIKNNRERRENRAPLFDAKVTKWEVAAFWYSQSFDLQLSSVNGKAPSGNCDLCFPKSAGTISGLIRNDPELADWWIKVERGGGRNLSHRPA
jgi:hypothetical protein